MKTVYAHDQITGKFIQPIFLDESDLSPLDDNVYLIPAGAVEEPPPVFDPDQQEAYWTGAAWQVVDVPVSTVEPPPEAPPVDPKEAIRAEITQLEVEHLLPRVTREFMLTLTAATFAGQGIDPMTNFAYHKVKELDDQIAALRAQL